MTKRVLRNVERAAWRRKMALVNFDRCILEARLAGCTLREIAPYANISNVGVMLAERRAREDVETIKSDRAWREASDLGSGDD